MTDYPTAWQRKVLWNAITAIAIILVGAIGAYLLVLMAQAISFLQPVLIPFAVAAVLAFLLDPVVRMLCNRTRLPRTWAVIVVFSFITLVVALLFISVVPQLYRQTANLAHDLPAYTMKAQKRLLGLVEATQRRLDQLDHLFPLARPTPTPAPEEEDTEDDLPNDLAPQPSSDLEMPDSPAPTAAEALADASASPAPSVAETSSSPAPSVAAVSPSPAPTPAAAAATPDPVGIDTTAIREYIQKQLPDLSTQVPTLLNKAWHLLLSSIGGVLGGVGILFNAIIIPIYLFFLLIESRTIARRWSEYLPMQDSPLKQELVSVLMEINGYLVAFFRGQLIVSTIDGLLIGSALYFLVHLDFSFFIGLLVVVLTFIPYLGIVLCYIPAVFIALIQYGDWQHPLAVVAVMFSVQSLEGFLIAPKIVGDSVGLHPLTVIISIFGWSLLFDGPLGAILAVPLTASLKVLLRRYVWEREARERARLLLVPLAVVEAGGQGPPGGGASLPGLAVMKPATTDAVVPPASKIEERLQA